MGVTAFFFAAEGSIDEVEAALRALFPDLLGGLAARPRNEGSVVEAIYRNDDDVLLALWQDGDHTGFAESTLGLFDEERLPRLSARLGRVIAVCIGDHGGSYVLHVYEGGRLRRALNNARAAEGEPLPQETGVSSRVDESSILSIWQAFGLTDFFEGVPPLRVLASEPSAADFRPKPWWKFW